MQTFDHTTYLSPFTWRYGSPEMRRIWSEVYRRRLWRRVWVALARAQMRAGLVTPEQVADLEAHVDDVDIEAAEAIEREIGHDVMAEIHVYARQCPVGGRILHLGATTMDITDNADALRLREALDLVLARVRAFGLALADQVERWADTPCMGFTHLQPAEPTTVGYRLAVTLQDVLEDYRVLVDVRQRVRGKGFRGAVGTAASYRQLLSHTDITPQEMEKWALEELGLEAFPVTTQVYPRKQDWQVITALAGVGQTLYRLAFDVRLLQSPLAWEWSEPFGARQVGSSAMPFKRNPVNAENIDSLARYLARLPEVVWENAAHSLLERTLDDSGNRRVVLAEAFLVVDEVLRRGVRVVNRLSIHTHAIQHNLQTYGTFAATERVLMETVKAGANRQEIHEIIREHSMRAWEAIQRGEPNPLPRLLTQDPRLTRWLPPDQIHALLDARHYVGTAPERARALAQEARAQLGSSDGEGTQSRSTS